MAKDNNVWLWVLVGIVVLLFFLFGSTGGYGMMGLGMGFGWFGFVFMVFFWVLIAWGVIYLIKQIGGPQREEPPLKIIGSRYARGEITKKQFDDMSRRLKK